MKIFNKLVQNSILVLAVLITVNSSILADQSQVAVFSDLQIDWLDLTPQNKNLPNVKEQLLALKDVFVESFSAQDSSIYTKQSLEEIKERNGKYWDWCVNYICDEWKSGLSNYIAIFRQKSDFKPVAFYDFRVQPVGLYFEEGQKAGRFANIEILDEKLIKKINNDESEVWLAVGAKLPSYRTEVDLAPFSILLHRPNIKKIYLTRAAVICDASITKMFDQLNFKCGAKFKRMTNRQSQLEQVELNIKNMMDTFVYYYSVPTIDTFVDKKGHSIAIEQIDGKDLENDLYEQRAIFNEAFWQARVESGLEKADDDTAKNKFFKLISSSMDDVKMLLLGSTGKSWAEGQAFGLSAKLDGKTIGFMVLSKENESHVVYIGQAAILPQYWDAGIAKRLVATILKMLPKTQKLLCIARKKNKVADRIYEHCIQKLPNLKKSNYMHKGYDSNVYQGYELVVEKA